MRGRAGRILLVAGLLALALSALQMRPAPLEPGVPVNASLPLVHYAALALLLLAFLFPASPLERTLAACAAVLAVALPTALLLPFGKFHDSDRNLVTSLAVIDGRGTEVYGGAYPGFWTFAGLLARATDADPWAFVRLFPLLVTLLYLALAVLLARGLARGGDGPEGAWTGAVVAGLLVLGPLVWIRNNLAPEALGFALGLLVLYAAARERGTASLIVFAVAALAVVVSHPLSPLLLLPGVLVLVLFPWRRGAAAPSAPARSAWSPQGAYLLGVFAFLYVAWLSFQGAKIVGRILIVVREALAADETTAVSQGSILPGTLTPVLVGLAAMGLLGLACAWLAWRGRRDRMVILSFAWVAAMVPALIAAAGGRFLTRPLLFLLVPFAILFAWGLARAEGRPRAALAAVLVVALCAGTWAGGYLESYDRTSATEVAAYAFAYARADPADVYQPKLTVHFDAEGRPFEGLPLAPTGTRAYDPARAAAAPVRIATEQSLAYAALQKLAPWPADVRALAEGAEADASLVYVNGDAAVFVQA